MKKLIKKFWMSITCVFFILVVMSFNVFALEKVEEDVLCHKYDGFFGVDSNAVLEEAFQTESVNLEVKDKVKKMYDFIEEKKYEDAEEIIREIEHMTRNRNRDTVRGRVLIRKGKKVNASNT